MKSAANGKVSYRQAQRVKPCGQEGLAACRKIVAEHQYAKVNEVMIDAFSASALVAVADKLNPENLAKLLAQPVGRACVISLKLCGL